MQKRSEVWNHFKRNERSREIASCMHCSKQLGCKGSSTTPLINHLKTHKILIVHNENASNPKKPSPKKIKTITENSILQYMKLESRDEIISRCVAEDG